MESINKMAQLIASLMLLALGVRFGEMAEWALKGNLQFYALAAGCVGSFIAATVLLARLGLNLTKKGGKKSAQH